MMRDDPLGKTIDIESLCKPSPFYAEQVANDEARLERLRGMTREELVESRRSKLKRDIAGYEKTARERAQIDARLDEMTATAEAWEPPSGHHDRLKEFMLEQLRMSKAGDLWSKEVERATKALEELDDYDTAEMIREAETRLDYSKKQLASEEARQTERRKWLTQLLESVPCPFTEEEPW